MKGTDLQVSERSVTPCMNPELRDSLFFSDDMGRQREAAALCFECPNMIRCGKDGEQEVYGVFGGKTQDDRPYSVWWREQSAAREAAELAGDPTAEPLEGERRDDMIRRLTREGKSKAQIAAALNVGTATVARVRALAA